MRNIENEISDILQKAVDDGKSFSKELDFSERSLTEVEDILEQYHVNLFGSPFKKFISRIKRQTENQIWSIAMMYGVYVDEVIRRNSSKNINWVIEEGLGNGAFLHLKLDDRNRINPVGKVYKRLKNGKEDEILFFYEVFKKQML